MNTRMLKSKMVLFDDTNVTMAEALGITPPAYSLKLNGENDFKQEEIKIIKERYNLTPEEVDTIFLT